MADRGSKRWSLRTDQGRVRCHPGPQIWRGAPCALSPPPPGVSGNAPRKEDINRKPQFKDVKGYNAHKTKGVERRNAAN